MNNTGRSVSFSGYSTSAQTEDTIGITVILWEQRGTTWYEVARASSQLRNADYVDASGTKTVDGGHYYKVTGTHTSSKNGTNYSGTSETAANGFLKKSNIILGCLGQGSPVTRSNLAPEFQVSYNLL